MRPDVTALRDFYAGRLGAIARRFIGARVKRHWPQVAGDRILGIGYATPYLSDCCSDAIGRLNFMPAAQGVAAWPLDAPNATALVLDHDLPLPGAAVDRILAIHALESAASVEDLIGELWRVLAPGGRLLIVVPNRTGIWARVESTPFGHGRPFSRGQLTTLLEGASFSPFAWSRALVMPPTGNRFFVQTGASWEKVGTALWPGLAGVLLVEATKLIRQPIPTGNRVHAKRALQPALAPPGG